MLKRIFILLCGENEEQRPRSKKLLNEIEKSKLGESEYVIIVSGLSSFDLNPPSSEASRLAGFLMAHGIKRENLILEEEAIDTLGNMVFSHNILEKLLEKTNPSPEVTLITEGFHAKRSELLFKKVFYDLIHKYNLNVSFVKANTFNISSFFWKRKLNVIAEKIKRKFIIGKGQQEYFVSKDISDYLQRAVKVRKRYMLDFLIQDVILTDADIFHLRTYDDFRNYLFSLPVYSNKYTPYRRYDLTPSLYAKLIEAFSRKK